MKKALLSGVAFAIASSISQAAPVMMGTEWAQEMCGAWNADATLTEELVGSEWVKNDKARGYKAIQIYRADVAACPAK